MNQSQIKRLTIQQISEFILNGTELIEPVSGTYKERLEAAQQIFSQELSKYHYLGSEEHKDIMDLFYKYGADVQNIYMGIGMQSGATLVVQLIGSTINDNK